MKKYFFLLLLFFVTNYTLLFSMQQRRPVGPSLFGSPKKQDMVLSIGQGMTRERLIERFERIVTGKLINFKEADKIIQMLLALPDAQSKAEGRRLQARLMNMRTYMMCYVSLKETKDTLAAAQLENKTLKEQLAMLKKQPGSTPAAKEMEEKVITAEKEVEKQTELVREMVSNYKELPALGNLRKRTIEEFGKKVFDKMSQDKELSLKDFDAQARFMKMIHAVDFGSGVLNQKDEEQALNQAKLLLAEYKQENEKLKERIEKAEKAEESADNQSEKNKKNDQLKKVQDELKIVKEQLQTCENQDISRTVLQTDLDNAKREIEELSQSKSEQTVRINSVLSRLFGDQFADTITNLSTNQIDEQNLLSKLNKGTAFMQQLHAAE